jgi:hypothetical protein
MPESDVQLILRAAALMRQCAEAATGGPWRTHDGWSRDGGYLVGVLTGDGNETRPVAWVPSFSEQPADLEKRAWPDGEHITSWSPVPVLAVAAWLESYRDEPDGADVAHRPDFYFARDLARAYLGEETT